MHERAQPWSRRGSVGRDKAKVASLPTHPAGEDVDIDENGRVIGLFWAPPSIDRS
jgi:hypothetical protein